MKDTRVARFDVAEIPLGASTSVDMSPTVDVMFTDPTGHERRVPAYVTNGEWRVRYSSGIPGRHHYLSTSSTGGSLTGVEGAVEVTAQGNSHGPLRVASDQRHLEHADGTPFLWLADTWWHGFVERLSDAEFRELAAKRAHQGFSVVQIVAGLYPEMEPFATEGRSNNGWAWHEDFTKPNLAWFDEADRRVTELLKHDLTPCIVGSWSHYLKHMDAKQLLWHWREMIARWGAYPVVWCLVGEPPVPASEDSGLRERLERQITSQRDVERNPYFAKILPKGQNCSVSEIREIAYSRIEQENSETLKRLNEVARGVREIEPYGRPITIHSQGVGRHPWLSLENEDLIDFWLPQSGHWNPDIVEQSVSHIKECIAHTPVKPSINGEPPYEGICGSHWQDTQRFLFWSHMLSGVAGHSYGAHGVWAFNTPEFPGFISGRAPLWKEAADFLGASHVGIGSKILRALPWYKFEPHPEWIEVFLESESPYRPYAAGMPDGIRVIYVPSVLLYPSLELRLRNLGKNPWRAQSVDPRTGKTERELCLNPDADGTENILGRSVNDPLPSCEDWILVLRPES